MFLFKLLSQSVGKHLESEMSVCPIISIIPIAYITWRGKEILYTKGLTTHEGISISNPAMGQLNSKVYIF